MLEGRIEISNKIEEITVGYEGLINNDNKIYKQEEVNILPPVTPKKIVGVGMNYGEVDLENVSPPIFFLKPPTSVIGHKDNICYHDCTKELIYEGELGIVIGKNCYNVNSRDALDYIRGYTCVNDVTDIGIFDGYKILLAKGLDKTCPIGPFIQTNLGLPVTVKTYLNDELRQSASTDQMKMSVPELVSYISKFMTLERGDIIASGTPAGTGTIVPGDKVVVGIDEIGYLENHVK